MGRNKQKQKHPRKDEYRSDILSTNDMHNGSFEAYYKRQCIIRDEGDEWESFLTTMRKPLPTVFRVAGSRSTARMLNAVIEDVHVPSLGGVVFEGEKVEAPAKIPWYPEGLAWQFNVPKKVLRKSTEFKKFHSFLVFETEVGNISRQEAVSMLPPLFMDVQPHHRVMDMCAAPGSKTAQLLEALHAHDTLTASSTPSGLLLANDSDAKRTHLLIHQSARLPSPALMVTNLDASNYPVVWVPQDGGKLEQLLFDRILCDVPCSGDGTMRKNVGIWKKWAVLDGNGLHGLQLRILERAMKMLKPDGRIVYSTCSLNPVENEAVVAAAIAANPDFHLLDVSAQYPTLRRAPGLTKWAVTNDKACEVFYELYAGFVDGVEEKARGKVGRTHFSPGEDVGLERCIRVYPHMQDTGGFFVAVLERRVRENENKNSSGNTRKRTAESSAPTQDAKKPKLGETVDVEALRPESSPDSSFKENPYTFLHASDATLTHCLASLHLLETFPKGNVLVRSPPGGAARFMYVVNEVVKRIIECNEYTRLRLTAAGTKVFGRQDERSGSGSGSGSGGGGMFRILGEGLPVVMPFVDPTRIVDVGMKELRVLVESYYPLVKSFGEPVRGRLEEKDLGSHIIRILPEQAEEGGARLTHELVLPIWKSGTSVALMIDKKAKSALSLRLYGADITTAGKQAREKAGEKAVRREGRGGALAEAVDVPDASVDVHVDVDL